MRSSLKGNRSRRGQQVLAQVIQKLSKPLIQKDKAMWAQMTLYWHTIVEEKIANYTQPLTCRLPSKTQPTGHLCLGVWGGKEMELSYQAPQIASAVNRYLGFGAIHKVSFRRIHSPIQRPDILRYERKNTSEMTKSTSEKPSLDQALARLKQAMEASNLQNASKSSKLRKELDEGL